MNTLASMTRAYGNGDRAVERALRFYWSTTSTRAPDILVLEIGSYYLCDPLIVDSEFSSKSIIIIAILI